MVARKLLSLVDLLQKDHMPIPTKETPQAERRQFLHWIAEALSRLIDRQGAVFRRYEVAVLQRYECEHLQREEPWFSDKYHIQDNQALQMVRQRFPHIRDAVLIEVCHAIYGERTKIKRTTPFQARHFRLLYRERPALERYVQVITAVTPAHNGIEVSLVEPYLSLLPEHPLPFNGQPFLSGRDVHKF